MKPRFGFGLPNPTASEVLDTRRVSVTARSVRYSPHVEPITVNKNLTKSRGYADFDGYRILYGRNGYCRRT
ncbi:hypothetical protein [Methylacidiphilum kamchatkense]|uniref:hypothetical protein n=1 Tax=Methylacidiphilum kamchatkense TaxID=431057 RepID=UPI00137931AE|nr:hypothetical protein [Methylacidiphilum kamchatkense]